MSNLYRKLKNLVTGERQDLNTGEVVDISDTRHEFPDPTPLAPAIGYKREPSLAEKIRNMVRSEQLRAAAQAEGAETFEEADDFEIGDDFEPASPYEGNFEPLIPEAAPAATPPAPSAEGAPAPVPAAPAAAPADPLPNPGK